MNWSKLLKTIRSNLLVTQVEMAEILGVSFASVNRWETGKFEPTMKIKRKIMELCKQKNIKLED
ncbi:MAG: helix-turn-helix transcriptional regulator [Bacilli bacterium]|nr:helix-turn-helix transcriptional regulator [Bacilli bacterium]